MHAKETELLYSPRESGEFKSLTLIISAKEISTSKDGVNVIKSRDYYQSKRIMRCFYPQLRAEGNLLIILI